MGCRSNSLVPERKVRDTSVISAHDGSAVRERLKGKKSWMMKTEDLQTDFNFAIRDMLEAELVQAAYHGSLPSQICRPLRRACKGSEHGKQCR